MLKISKSLGDEGEENALKYLRSRGYDYISKNYRYKRNEIDLIVKKKEIIVFVEVKYRTSNQFGYPESFVDAKKIKRLQLAADNFIYDLNWKGNIRFDIIAIDRDQRIEHFKDIC